MRVGEAEGDPEGDGRRTLANGWESRLWRLEDEHLREGSSVRQFRRPHPLRIRHRRRRSNDHRHPDAREVTTTSIEREYVSVRSYGIYTEDINHRTRWSLSHAVKY